MQGETGSPLVNQVAGQVWLEGLHSWDAGRSDGCEVTGLPTVFSSVPSMADWVASVTNTRL